MSMIAGVSTPKLSRGRSTLTRWLDNQTASIVSGNHVAPRDAQLTVQQWCDLWIEGYKVNRESTVRQARTHIHQIVDLCRPRNYAEPAAACVGNLGSGVLIGSSNSDWSA
jgi:hypothetical protein